MADVITSAVLNYQCFGGTSAVTYLMDVTAVASKYNTDLMGMIKVF